MMRYVGNAHYCYAYGASMLLSSIREDAPPSLLEVLTGVGLGAWKGRRFFLGMNSPDEGLTEALTILGYGFQEEASHRDEGAPFDRLREILDDGPALLGPLDVGYLTYFPERAMLAGSDHYALAYAMDGDAVYLHDPAGFPHVHIKMHEMENAWRARRVTYRRAYYRLWHSPERQENPSGDEIYGRAMGHFREIYEEKPPQFQREGNLSGVEAINAQADEIRRGKTTVTEKNMLVYFTLALGSKRALDYAFFFKDHDEELSRLKLEQSRLLGECHTLSSMGDWMRVGDVLLELGEVEHAFREELLSR